MESNSLLGRQNRLLLLGDLEPHQIKMSISNSSHIGDQHQKYGHKKSEIEITSIIQDDEIRKGSNF